MTISVILPVLNEARALPRTLAHTLALAFDEILVVDGGSHDRTCEIAAQCVPPPRLLAAPAGRAVQMNAGAAASRGEVLLFLHADTQLPPDARTAIAQALADKACVGGRFDVRFERDRGWAWLVGRLINLRSRYSGIFTGDQAMFVRRSAFERMGGFSAIPLMEDIDFSRRLKRLGRVAALRSQVLTSFRRWETRGPIRTILLMWSLRFLYWIGVSPWTLSRWYTHAR